MDLYSTLNRPFARSGHMVRNKLYWEASYAVGLPKQKRVGLDWYEFLCLKVPLCNLRPSIIYSVPSDQIVQKSEASEPDWLIGLELIPVSVT